MTRDMPSRPNENGAPKSSNRRRRRGPKLSPDQKHGTGLPGPPSTGQDLMEIDDDSATNDQSNGALHDGTPYSTLAGRIDKNILDTILLDLKFKTMTPIQAAAIGPLLEGKDVLGQARTGTGKTLAFLIPAIESLLKSNTKMISALVISPTRELVLQIAAEAHKLLSRYPRIRVCTAIGGTNKVAESKRLSEGCQILVATPGRLLDHLQEEQLQYQLSTIQTLILDEADRMLDMGFLPDIKRVISYLPQPAKSPRQSMLFSATVPESIIGVTRTILKPNYQTISTIPEGEGNTHKRVKQYYVQVDRIIDLAPALLAAIGASFRTVPDFKAIVFAPTAVLADYYAHILSHSSSLLPSVKISTMHSRMSQPARTRTTNDFRTAKNAICVATDVIARGMDFPLVTHVFQVGLPMDRESYIHRLGRTARAENDGQGVLILSSSERRFLRELHDVNFLAPAFDTAITAAQEAVLAAASRALEEDKKGKIYQGWLGYYKAMTRFTGWSSEQLVGQGNAFAVDGLACPEIPELERGTVGKMGLAGTPGLRIGPNRPKAGRAGGGRGGGGGGARGGRSGGGRGRGGGAGRGGAWGM